MTDIVDFGRDDNADISEEEALQEFLLDIDCLNSLSKWTSRFNFFDVLKITRTEIRHSNMLAWLLDPSESHGLGSQVLKGLLRYVVRSADESEPVFPVLTMDLDNVTVLREWNNIDIVVVSHKHHFMLCIENKIDSSEHNDQLKKYADLINDEYVKEENYDCRFIYLTPLGNESSIPDIWKSMGYREILSILEPIIENASLAHGAELLIKDYLEIIRRDIVEDYELSEICKDIYEKHRVALDLLYENRPDRAYMLSELFKKWAHSKAKSGEIIFDPQHSVKSFTRFHTPYLSSLIPDAPNTISGWGCSSHYFWEISQDRGEAYRLLLTFNKQEMPKEQIALVKRIVTACQEGNLANSNKKNLSSNWVWRTQFSLNKIQVGIDIDEDEIFKNLDKMLKKAFDFERKLKTQLDI